MFYNSLTCILRASGGEAARSRSEGADAPLIEDDGQNQQPLQHQADVMFGDAQPVHDNCVIRRKKSVFTLQLLCDMSEKILYAVHYFFRGKVNVGEPDEGDGDRLV